MDTPNVELNGEQRRRKRENERINRRIETLVDKAFALGELDGIDVALIICKRGQYTTRLCYPGLKEQISNLSCVLPGIVASDIPTKQLVIETIPSHDLSDHPFEELFQFSSDRNSSELGEPSSEEPSQMSKEAVNTPQTDTAVGPSDQRQANERVQGTIESVQDTQPDSTSKSLQSFSPSTEIKNGSLSNPIIDYSESAHPSAYHEQSDHHEELSQQSHRHINNRSPL
ncbi:hypothetical protein DL98DRAFT_600487 [Cadophora sp. DSE1049]|nr:hypothetical protein DL98DRAFT_600487 [Cadophora sp. DSE1049]